MSLNQESTLLLAHYEFSRPLIRVSDKVNIPRAYIPQLVKQYGSHLIYHSKFKVTQSIIL